MAKKNVQQGEEDGRAGDRGGDWEYCAALLPIRFIFVPFGTGNLGSDIKLKPGRPVLMQYVDDAVEQKRFYEALLELPWLALIDWAASLERTKPLAACRECRIRAWAYAGNALDD